MRSGQDLDENLNEINENHDENLDEKPNCEETGSTFPHLPLKAVSVEEGSSELGKLHERKKMMTSWLRN